MPVLQLSVDNTYRRLYDRRVHSAPPHQPTITTALPTRLRQHPQPPRPSLTQPTDSAPTEFPFVEQMPFKPSSSTPLAWGMTDTTLILFVFAIGVVLGVLYPPDDEFDDDDVFRWEDELTPEIAAAIQRHAAARAARNLRLAPDEGYETDREDN